MRAQRRVIFQTAKQVSPAAVERDEARVLRNQHQHNDDQRHDSATIAAHATTPT
jgi:hypothetical protein